MKKSNNVCFPFLPPLSIHFMIHIYLWNKTCIVTFKRSTKCFVFCVSDERENVQKKTFQKWVNSHLVRVNRRIGDLYVDLRDGKNLLVLLEVLSGERLVRIRYWCEKIVERQLQIASSYHRGRFGFTKWKFYRFGTLVQVSRKWSPRVRLFRLAGMAIDTE